ncbi:MAG TPA: trigger factor [Deltaproteobacteria bacterium]|nr:trigger factor [Deltaproteobacteria bacterium]HQB39369.1 trigger factor [Deltaproteobacteria bacterium]
MQVQVETINSVTKKLNIEVPVEQVNSEIEKSYAAIQKRAKLQGFRPGKAPMSLVRRTYSDAMRDDVMRRLYEKTLFKALDENKIEPLDPPSIESDMLAEGEPFKYSATVEVMPEVKVKGYKGLELTKEKYVPSPESVEGEIVRMRENMAQLVPVEEGAAVENGHVVILDYTFSVDGFPEETQNADEAEVQVGANLLMPGFEEQLVGMKVGEERAIRITLPEGYRNPEAAGKEGVFQVTLKEIKRKELPELDDEFAQQFGEYENMEQLRAKLTEYREQHELDRIDMALKDMVIEKLIEKNPLDVPQAMVNRQLEFMLNNLKNRLKVQQMTLEMMGLNDDIFKVRFCDMAVSKVKGGLLLMALVEKEKIEAGDDELEKRYEQMASGNADLLEKIRQYHATNQSARERLISEIKDEKAIQFLLDNAKITEVEAPAKQGE